jgi:hypothetical protein
MLGKWKKLKILFDVALRVGATTEQIHRIVKRIQQQIVISEIDSLRKEPRYQTPKNLIPFGYKIYSQNDEDGIIREIFNRIGVTNRVFIEFGAGNGLENNTLALLFDQWNGLWIEASSKFVHEIKTGFCNTLNSGRLKIIESYVKKNNINHLISSSITDKEIDLLSIDIDGNDAHIFEAITCISPRVVVIEYHAKFRPPISFCMKYDESFHWKGDDCGGASLKYMENIFSQKGYNLVGCSITGVNAFFVRKDLTADKFLEPYSAENHYEPIRLHLAGFSSGNAPSYETLEKSQ